MGYSAERRSNTDYYIAIPIQKCLMAIFLSTFYVSLNKSVQ